MVIFVFLFGRKLFSKTMRLILCDAICGSSGGHLMTRTMENYWSRHFITRDAVWSDRQEKRSKFYDWGHSQTPTFWRHVKFLRDIHCIPQFRLKVVPLVGRTMLIRSMAVCGSTVRAVGLCRADCSHCGRVFHRDDRRRVRASSWRSIPTARVGGGYVQLGEWRA